MDLREYVTGRVQRLDSGCWRWRLSLGSHGYGQAWDGNTVTTAHRVAYRAFNGPIPDGRLVQHKCDNRWCVAPAHLELGDDASNALDKKRKGRAAKKLGTAQAAEIRRLVGAGRPQREIAAAFGISQPLVSSIALGKVW